MTVIEAITVPCRMCAAPVTRRLPENPAPLTRRLARAFPAMCETCIELDERRELEQAQREQAARRREGIARSGLPGKYRGLTLDSLDHPQSTLERITDWADDGGGLLLTGEIGRGKTTLAGAGAWRRLQHSPVVWTSAPLLFARLGAKLGSDERSQGLDVLYGTGALVLDDIEKVRPSEFAAEQVFAAVDQRVEHNSPLLVTSNLSPAQLAQKWPDPFGQAIASRLVGYCRTLRIEGVDRRINRQTLEGKESA